MTKIYFAGSIRGGRDDKDSYSRIIQLLSRYGTVLTEHVGDAALSASGETGSDEKHIYERDMRWLRTADVFIAEVSTPSLGVGYEIAKAEELGKKILCIYRPSSEKKLSAMVAGNKDIVVKNYGSEQELERILGAFFS